MKEKIVQFYVLINNKKKLINNKKKMIRKASAEWTGNPIDGKGLLTSTSGVLNNTPYSFATRFLSADGKAGTNPEELIAAAHAGCFTMAISFSLSSAGFVPDQIHTEVILTVEKVGDGWEIKSSHLNVSASVPKIDDELFQKLVKDAADNCPVSRALRAITITHEAHLEK